MTDEKRPDAKEDTLTGAYALNALPPEERDAFESTLEDSESTRHEVTELADTAVLLGLAVEPVAPPSALKASIMDRIQSMPQLPPLAGDVPAAAVAAQAEPAPTEPAAVAAPAASGPAERRAESRWFTRPTVVLASAAAALGLIAGGGLITNTIIESNTQNVQANRLAEINAARDTQRAVAEVAGGGTATLVWSNELLASAVMVDGLETLPAGKVYELWYIGDDGPRPAGTFTVGSDGSTWRVLDGEMKAGDTVGVTVEPSGGSPKPTTEPIVAIASA